MGGDLTWTYDLAGNRGTEVDPTGTTTYTPDALNRYTSIAGQRQEPGLACDADGNLTQDAIWTYIFAMRTKRDSAKMAKPPVCRQGLPASQRLM